MMATEKRLIDASDALEQLKQAEKEMKVVTPLGCKAVDIKAVFQYIESRPTVDAVEVVHGRWKSICLAGGFSEEWGYVCSECGCTVSERSGLGVQHFRTNQRLNYCPNCGAKMDGDGNA